MGRGKEVPELSPKAYHCTVIQALLDSVQTMRLESFSVENFRSITQANKLPLSNSTVLIGPNNEGKSNILRALNAAMFALTRSRVAPSGRRTASGLFRVYDWERDFSLSLRKSKTNQETKVTLDFILDEDEIRDFKLEVGSNLNGVLPVAIILGKEDIDVRIMKQGKGSITLNSKRDRIATFLASRIQFNYMPAVRTADHSAKIVDNIISAAISELEEDIDYIEAINSIKKLQEPVLNAFSDKMTETLKAFLPGIRSVRFTINDEKRYSALRQINIDIDDGAVTSLESKGDGVQSLVALGLRRHQLEQLRERQTYIFAIEEPEAHLHSSAIYDLKTVLTDLSNVDQIIITTHSGLLANRSPIASNIIVNRSTANPAKSLSQIRSSLGIRSIDNLINADVVLLVEGDDDKLAIRPILEFRSEKIKTAFATGRLIVDSLDGAGSLGAKIGLYKSLLCQVHCFLDNDDSGRTALDKARRAGLIMDADYCLTILNGKANVEFEDLLKYEIYKNQVKSRFGVDLDICKPRNRSAKWSERMSDAFAQAGKRLDDATKQRLKFVVAESVAEQPDVAVATHADTIFDNLIASVELKLEQI